MLVVPTTSNAPDAAARALPFCLRWTRAYLHLDTAVGPNNRMRVVHWALTTPAGTCAAATSIILLMLCAAYALCILHDGLDLSVFGAAGLDSARDYTPLTALFTAAMLVLAVLATAIYSAAVTLLLMLLVFATCCVHGPAAEDVDAGR